MNRILLGLTTAAAIGMSMTAAGAPYEDQKVQVQRVQQEKLQAAGTDAAAHEHSAGDHMQLMQEMRRQMQQAHSVDQMSTEQMRGWIRDHTQLMERMHQEMMNEQRSMHGPGTMNPAPTR